MICAVLRSSDEERIAWPRVVDVCGLREIHERLVVRDVVASIHDCIVSGETRVVLATYCPSLRVHTRRREAALEPAPSDALGIQQVSHVFTGHSDLVDALKLGI